ncbi:HopJ type III effector protein [Pedobacter changchengzhani]|uniref:HopJ type III effector protein n=1 Tax=Pedobacter changchengzhani TaxID=2529274 RepID=A0A4R5MKQ9_9SPHI|nr:HopJ type III effector protein [Pedobacter changchengzhani]TDG36006.1 HopJ type III effector protein [Pedobacter changchengzhani]
MKNKLETLLASLKLQTSTFSDVVAHIEKYYEHQPTAFRNGNVYNESSQNQGSAKVFAFAKINHLNVDDTLSLFGEHYQAVLANPDGTDHQNIRQFMVNGWAGITFEGKVLTEREL